MTSAQKLIAMNDESGEPITLAQARAHLRLDTSGSPPSHPDDSLVTALITAARESAEAFTGLAIVEQTYLLVLDEFPEDEIDLGVWPVRSIDSITYVDELGATQTLSSSKYLLDPYDRPARLQPTEPWPATKSRLNAITITMTVGMGAGSPTMYNVPIAIERGMLMLIGHLYENRESVNIGNVVTAMPMATEYLLMPYRIKMGV
jgi:uncharacterized phiE125 gp8 family phage protein